MTARGNGHPDQSFCEAVADVIGWDGVRRILVAAYEHDRSNECLFIVKLDRTAEVAAEIAADRKASDE